MSTIEDAAVTQIVDELIIKHIGATTFSMLAGNEQKGIRQALRAAIATGSNMELVRKVQSPIQKTIAADMIAFENTLNGENTSKEESKLYPWGWCYVDSAVQDKFREFCRQTAPVA